MLPAAGPAQEAQPTSAFSLSPPHLRTVFIRERERITSSKSGTDPPTKPCPSTAPMNMRHESRQHPAPTRSLPCSRLAARRPAAEHGNAAGWPTPPRWSWASAPPGPGPDTSASSLRRPSTAGQPRPAPHQGARLRWATCVVGLQAIRVQQHATRHDALKGSKVACAKLHPARPNPREGLPVAKGPSEGVAG